MKPVLEYLVYLPLGNLRPLLLLDVHFLSIVTFGYILGISADPYEGYAGIFDVEYRKIILPPRLRQVGLCILKGFHCEVRYRRTRRHRD